MGCCCGSKSGCRCCCCGKRGATITFGLLGLVLAAAVITPPVYIYQTDQDFTKMFPILKFGRMYLAQATGSEEMITSTSTTPAPIVVKDDQVKDLEEIDDAETLENEHARTYRYTLL